MRVTRSSGLIFIVGLLACLALFYFAAKPSKDASRVNGDLFVRALANYARDCRTRGQPLPQSVTLEDLVRGGYLRTEDAGTFEGVAVTFFTDAPDETRPQNILVAARLPDGTVQVVLGDGSVQAFTAQRFAEHLKASGQKAEVTNTTRAPTETGVGP